MDRSRPTKKLIRNAGIAFVLGASMFAAPSYAQKEGLARETLEQLVTVPPSDLSDADLALRIQLNRRLLKDNVGEIGGIKLKNLLRADRQELRKRGKSDGNEENTAEAAEPAPQETEAANQQNERQQKRAERRAAEERAAQEQAAKEKAAQEAAAENERQRKRQEAAAAAAAKERAAADKAAADKAAADTAAAERAAARGAEAQRAAQQQQSDRQPRADRLARQSLQDNRSSDDMTVIQLRERIAASEDILQNDDLRRALKRALNDRITSDRAALESKLAARQDRRDDRQADRAEQRQERRAERQENRSDRQESNQRARQLLEDQRPAAQLGLPELRERVQRTRDALQAEDMRQNLNKQLLARLSEDRDELRNRVAQREGRTRDRNVRDQVLDNRNARNELLSDRRSSSRLDNEELDRRIEQTSALLESARLRQTARTSLEQMLRSDRAEKRERLLQAREDRRRRLNRQARQSRDFTIQLGQSGIRFDLDIVAAEEDNEAIQDQLLAAPRREIRQRYTLNEFREQPELRDIMPGIELDTIRFGTNEAFIRAEEIGNLDAIGETIEEIVYSQPDEVFLIEGHTDAVGSASYNYALSEERAMGVREALLDYFNIPARNLVAIGYGERYLRIPTPLAEQENRRVSVRRITPLLAGN